MRTGMEYHDIFPVWDWMKVPGTTVRITPALEGGVRFKGTRAFAGGVSDGRYGCAAFDMERGGLVARKSWFFFDDEVVCLGAGISSAKSDTVVTTLNQCFLKSDVTVSRAGEKTTVPRGARGLDSVEWVYHDGVAYLFPGSADVRLSNGLRSGTWWDINHTHSKDMVNRDVFTLWFDHGMSPSNARYAYIVAPDLAPGDAGKYYADPPVEILSNESAVQSVRHKKLGVTGIAFYAPGRMAIGKNLAVEADRPCLLLLRETAQGLRLSASNPVNEGMLLTVRFGDPVKPGSFETVVFDLPDGLEAGMSQAITVKR
jgi:chondroitin AC lyase